MIRAVGLQQPRQIIFTTFQNVHTEVASEDSGDSKGCCAEVHLVKMKSHSKSEKVLLFKCSCFSYKPAESY